MSRIGSIAAAGFLGLAIVPAVGAQANDKKVVVGVIETMFAALAKGDTAAMRATFHPQARVVQTGTGKDGKPFNRVNSIDDFLKSIGAAAGKKLEEQVMSPVVQIEDNLAVVWAAYRFLVDGKASHCGVDSYQLVRTDAGWKLLHIVDTQKPCGK
jgi:ketosteroid isomerase-like protein